MLKHFLPTVRVPQMPLIQTVLCLFLLVCDSGSESLLSDGLPGDPCEMGGGVIGQCEEVGSCLKDGGVVQRTGQVRLCRALESKIYVCCRKPHRIAEELCTSWASYWRGGDKGCIKEVPLIFGGMDAEPGEFPHIAIIGYQSRPDSITWACGGSLISPHFVLTAAHCVKVDSLRYFVELGEHDRNFQPDGKLPRIMGPIPSSLYRAEDLIQDATHEAPVKQHIAVAEVLRHPEYHPAPKYNDIALLRLEKPATLTRRVLPACLPTDVHLDLANKNLDVAGWGRTDQGLSELTPVLQKVTVPVNRLLECQATIASHDRGTVPIGLLEDQLCAGKQGRDTCTGDSGGPLMYQQSREGRVCEQTVVGVVSFGYGCGNFGIYARVSSYLDWITGYIAPNASS